MHRVFRRKSLDHLVGETTGNNPQLRRTLGPFHLTLLGVGAIIGAGIFSTIGSAAAGGADHVGAGPALVVSFALVAVACGFAALCYAEFAALVPVSGSAYTYAYATLGELVAWIIGWDLILEYAVGNVAVAISWSDYFQSLVGGFGFHWPLWLGTDLRSALQAAHNPHFPALRSGPLALSGASRTKQFPSNVGEDRHPPDAASTAPCARLLARP
jgi:APA family basic amino acid/polyamine antiporter